jgi:hypothetical protein
LNVNAVDPPEPMLAELLLQLLLIEVTLWVPSTTFQTTLDPGATDNVFGFQR